MATYMYPDGGGISSIIENTVHALADYEVHLAITVELADREPRHQLPPQQVHPLGQTKLFRPTVMPFSLLYPLRAARFLRQLVRRLRPAAVLTQDALYLPVPAAIATRGTDAKLVVLDHGTLTNQLDAEWQRIARERMGWTTALAYRIGFALDTPWRALRWRLGLRAADAAWYVGEELEPYFSRAGERAARHAPIVPADFTPPTPQERAAARRELGVDEGTTVFNLITRLDGEKGLDTLLDAIDGVLRVRSDFRVVVAGDGALAGWMSEETEKRNLEQHVRMVGRVERGGALRIHHGSDFHLYAGTVGCSVGLGLLEAMACQVIPIASNAPAAHSTLVGDAGWVFPAGDSDALRKAMLDALDTSQPERDKLRRAAVKQLEALPDPHLERLLQALLDGEQRPHRRDISAA